MASSSRRAALPLSTPAWEEHKKAVSGLGFLAFSAAAAAVLVGAGWMAVLRGVPRGAVGLVPLCTLVAVAVLGLALGISARARGGDLVRPLLYAHVVTLLTVAAGALVAVSTHATPTSLSLGLFPFVLLWPALMPGGARAQAGAILGGLGIHLLVLVASGVRFWNGTDPAALGVLVVLTGAGLLFAERRRRLESRSELAERIDPLTQTLNRPAMSAEMRLLMSRRSRHLGAVSLVLLDVDRFMTFNDTRGRRAGDEVLEQLGTILRGELRIHDLVGRHGADEFLLVLDDCDGQNAVMILERIRDRLLQKPLLVAGQPVKITFAAGVISLRPGETLPPEELVRATERAMEESRDAQLNRTSLAQPAPAPTHVQGEPPPQVQAWDFPPAPSKAAPPLAVLPPPEPEAPSPGAAPSPDAAPALSPAAKPGDTGT